MSRKNAARPTVSVGRRVDPKGVVIILLLVGAVAAAWFLWAAPARDTATSLGVQLEQVNTQVTQSATRVAQLESGELSGAPDLLAQARDLDARFPSFVDKMTLVAQVPSVAAGYGLQVVRMDPVDPAGAASTSSVEFDVTVTGSYDQVMKFLTDFTAADAALVSTIRDLTVDVGEQETTASFMLTVHYSGVPPLGSLEPPAPDADGGVFPPESLDVQAPPPDVQAPPPDVPAPPEGASPGQ